MRSKHSYATRYIIIILLCHFLGEYLSASFTRISLIYIFSRNILVIPASIFLILFFGILKPLNNDKSVSKKDIYIPFLFTTSLFNLLFFFFAGYGMTILLTVLISNFVIFTLIKTKKNAKQLAEIEVEKFFRNKK